MRTQRLAQIEDTHLVRELQAHESKIAVRGHRHPDGPAVLREAWHSQLADVDAGGTALGSAGVQHLDPVAGRHEPVLAVRGYAVVALARSLAAGSWHSGFSRPPPPCCIRAA